MKRTKILKNMICWLMTAILALNFTSCSDISGIHATDLMDGIEAAQAEGKDADDAFIDAQLSFALELFQGSVAASEQDNLLISPLSVMLALAMTANGADGETKAEMEALLGGELSIETLNQYLYSYVNALPSDDKAKLNIANSIWFRDDESAIDVSTDFLQTNADYYNASAYKAPFDDQTVKDINKWVSLQTDGMIDRIVDQIPPNMVMYLINALAFDAEWYSSFSSSFDATFTSIGGEERKVKMMSSTEPVYLNDGIATGFMKQYAGSDYAFAALLPGEDVDIYEYIEGLTAESLMQTLQGARNTDVRIKLPKFSYDYSLEMKDLLCAMGMPTAFDGTAADFSALGHSSAGNIFIGEVLHKTYIEVDEKGTQAGAVTKVGIQKSAMPSEPLYSVTLDRPFVYMIIDNATDLPIFMGVVTDITE